jgi:hypothetical protein
MALVASSKGGIARQEEVGNYTNCPHLLNAKKIKYQKCLKY